MKHYFLLALAIIAVLVSGCKNENQNTDPSNPQSTDTGERDYSVRVYVTQDMIDYFDYGVYVTLPNQQESKLSLDNPVALDSTLDETALEKLAEVSMEASDLKVCVLNTKGQKGQAKLRFTLALKADAQLPEKINTIWGYVFYGTGAGHESGGDNYMIYKGLPQAGVTEFIGLVDGSDETFDIK